MSTIAPHTFYDHDSRGYQWPPELIQLLSRPDLPAFRAADLVDLAAGGESEDFFLLTCLSSDYLALGIAWANFVRRAGITRFGIAAMDPETWSAMRALRIPVFAVETPSCATFALHQNRGGFGAKAMALIYLRTQLVKCLVEHGVNVIACDVDALIIRDPRGVIAARSSMAFQRVVFFPKVLAKRWGFALCAGFAAYRGRPEVASFLAKVIELQRIWSSDQLALNAALFSGGVEWDTIASFEDESELKSQFIEKAAETRTGWLPVQQMWIEALPATTVWRHAFVPLDKREVVVLHPNSPKSLDAKLQALRASFGREDLALRDALEPPKMPQATERPDDL